MNKALTHIEAILFDMDGVLMFSEPFWRKAEYDIYQREYGIQLTDHDVHLTTGLKTTEVVELHNKNYNLNSDPQILGHEIEKRVIEQVLDSGKAMEGLKELTEYISSMNWRRCLVTSSSSFVYDHIVRHVGLDHFFEQKFTAYDEAKGKPDPAVYLSAIQYLNIPKKNILVIEDSLNGVKAAHAAGLRVLGLPEENNRENPEYLCRVEKIFDSHFEILEWISKD